MHEFFNTDLYSWVVLPLLIALSRILDVTIGTIRLIFVSRGYKYVASLLGFVEVIIWLVAIGEIMQHLGNVMSYIAYGAGFAAGNFIGINLVDRMSLGTVVIRIIPKKDTSTLIEKLRAENYGVTSIDAQGKMGPVQVIFSIVKRKNLKSALRIINEHNPQSFYTVEEVETVKDGFFKVSQKRNILQRVNPVVYLRK